MEFWEKKLKLRAINARWLPHLFCDERMENAKKLPKLYMKYTKNTFESFLTGDETCVYNFSQNIWSLTESGYQRMQNVLSISER